MSLFASKKKVTCQAVTFELLLDVCQFYWLLFCSLHSILLNVTYGHIDKRDFKLFGDLEMNFIVLFIYIRAISHFFPVYDLFMSVWLGIV